MRGRVRSLRAQKITPKLAIVQAKDDPVIDVYVNLKQKYGADIGADVEVHKVAQTQVPGLLKKLNKDDTVHGIISPAAAERHKRNGQNCKYSSAGKRRRRPGQKCRVRACHA
jgi:hypothetical protein